MKYVIQRDRIIFVKDISHNLHENAIAYFVESLYNIKLRKLHLNEAIRCITS